MTPPGGDLGVADLTVLDRFANPNMLVKAGAKRLTLLITKVSQVVSPPSGPASGSPPPPPPLELYAGHAAVALDELATDREVNPCLEPGRRCCTTMVRATDTARKQDPQLAHMYYQQLVERGS